MTPRPQLRLIKGKEKTLNEELIEMGVWLGGGIRLGNEQVLRLKLTPEQILVLLDYAGKPSMREALFRDAVLAGREVILQLTLNDKNP